MRAVMEKYIYSEYIALPHLPVNIFKNFCAKEYFLSLSEHSEHAYPLKFGEMFYCSK